MDLEPLLRRIRGEFMEMPGLRLTPPQAMRLWGVDRELCERVVNVLVGRAFLRLTPNGVIVRAGSDA